MISHVTSLVLFNDSSQRQDLNHNCKVIQVTSRKEDFYFFQDLYIFWLKYKVLSMSLWRFLKYFDFLAKLLYRPFQGP